MAEFSSADSGPLEIDTLIHAKWLIPMTQDVAVLDNYSLAIKGEKIVSIEPTETVKTHFTSVQEYHLDTHAVIPGLINAHGHSAMTLFRGFADDIPLKPWLEEKIWPAETKWVSEEFVYDGALLAIAEMLRGGISCFSDMYFFPDHVARAALDAKIRVQLAAPVLDFATIWAQDPEEYIHKATLLYDQYKNNEFVYTAFGPHAPYSVSDAALEKISTLSGELEIPIHIHVHENAREIEEAINITRIRPLQRLHELGLLSSQLQCVHMTQLSDEEIALLAENSVNVVHCPSSNMKLASGFCPVDKLLRSNINVCLGTDGAASNDNLDMFNEMRLAAFIGKGFAEDASALSARQVLKMATINAAKSMGLDHLIGSLEIEKFADIVAVDLEQINSQPVYDPVSSLVYSCNSSQVSHVWVGGKLNVEAGKLKNIDTGQLMESARSWAQKIQHDS